MCSPIYKMVSNTTDPNKCKNINFLLVKTYISCYLYHSTNLPFDNFVQRARAPIEHVFNCHLWCDDAGWNREIDDKEQKMTEHVLRSHDVKLEDNDGSSNEDGSVNVDGGDNNGENDAIFDSSGSECDDNSSEDSSDDSR